VYTTPSWNNLHQAQTQKMEKLKKCGAKKTQKGWQEQNINDKDSTNKPFLFLAPLLLNITIIIPYIL
jgi:DNA polymerase/3'-5' exonuclease PolX